MKQNRQPEKTRRTRTKGSKPLTLLVITTHNLFSENGIRSQIRGKTRALETQGVKVFFFCTRFGGITPAMRKRAQGNIIGTGASEQWLRQSPRLLKELTAAVATTRPDWVLVSGVWLCLWGDRLGRIIKNSGALISYDMHGPVEEIAEYQRVFGSRWLAKLLALGLARAEHRFLARWTDLIETVSHAALDYLRQHRARFTGKVCLVHCGFEKALSEQQHARYRKEWQARLRIDESRPAVVFAGTLSGWQNKPALFAFARKHKETSVFFFVPPRHHAEIRSLELPHARALFLPSDKLQQALCAFDYGLLPREATLTNTFAFPLKVSEYANARLPILVTYRNMGWMRGVLARACLDLEAFPQPKRAFQLSYRALQSLTFDRMVANLTACYRANA